VIDQAFCSYNQMADADEYGHASPSVFSRKLFVSSSSLCPLCSLW
jgi:hypothetical protein